MKFILKASLALSLIAPVLAGCDMDVVGSKKIADPNAIAQIVPGRSTKADVQSAFGTPSQTAFSDNGDETWTYVHMSAGLTSAAFIPMGALFAAPSKSNNDTLVVRFDQRGVVRNVGRGQVSSSPNGLLN